MSKAAAAEKRGSLVWLQGLACGALAAMLPGTAVLLGVLMGPGMVALMLDHQPAKPVARSVLLCGAAACVQPMTRLWNAGHTVDAALYLLSDVGALGTAWSAAAAGWLLAELLPVCVRVALEAVTVARAARLRASRERLLAEWGPDDAPGQ